MSDKFSLSEKNRHGIHDKSEKQTEEIWTETKYPHNFNIPKNGSFNESILDIKEQLTIIQI